MSGATLFSNGVGIETTNDLGIYLGAYMIPQRISKHVFYFMISHTKVKLVGWNTFSFSPTGHIIIS